MDRARKFGLHISMEFSSRVKTASIFGFHISRDVSSGVKMA
jgi:hypothetical protein